MEITTTGRDLARYLAHRQADWEEKDNRPLDDKLARARVEGAAGALHAIGFGRTPTEIEMVVMDWVRANPRPPGNFGKRDQVGFPDALKAWNVKAEDEVMIELEKLL